MIDCVRSSASVRVSETTKQKLLQLGVAAVLGIGALAAASGAQAANTGITAIVVQSTGLAFGGCSIPGIGTYTYYQGYATDSVDPTNPLNSMITDISLAPKDSNGNVGLYFNFQMVLPTNLANFNGKIVADWPNRSSAEAGSLGVLSTTVTATSNCSGTFLYPKGYGLVQAGWEQDGAGDPTNGLSTNTFNGKFGAAGINSYLATGANVPKMPVATNNGATITGPGYEYIVSSGTSFTLGGGIAFPNYPAVPLGGPCSTSSADFLGSFNGSNVLTHRKHLDDTPTVLPSTDWQFNLGVDGNCDSISLTAAAVTDGNAAAGPAFINNDIYELSYLAAQPTVNGLGLAINRDWYSWLKGNSGSAAQGLNPFKGTLKQIYMTSVSQPDRTFNDYVNLGFNGDLNGKIVDDGAVNLSGAGAGLAENYRWSHTTETQRNRQQHLWVENFFPFSDATTFDPISGTTDGKNLVCSKNNTCPINMNVWAGNEYWVKNAALTHVDPTGTFDLPDSTHPFARYIYVAGTQHTGGSQSTRNSAGSCQFYGDPISISTTLRSTFTVMDQYINGHIPLVASQVPTLAAGQLVSPTALKFPSGYKQTVTGVNGGQPFPVLYTALETTPYRFNFGPNFYSPTSNGRGQAGQPWMIPTINPPIIQGVFERNPANGPIYADLVPNVNSDGNETAGLMLPEVQVPLGTYAGWSYRSGGINAPTPDNDGPDGCESSGLFIPFYNTVAARQAASDPRPSVAERYPTYASFLDKVVNATDNLVSSRFLLCGTDTATVIANQVQDYSAAPPQGAGLSTGGLTAQSLLPACNVAMTHNLSGGNSGLPSVSGAAGGNASSVLFRDNSGNVGAWLMNGSSIAKTAVLGNVPNTWSVIGQRDFNGDGNADILWRDTSGNVGIWLMNGTSIQSTAVLGNMPTTSSVVATMGFNTGGYGSILWRDNQGNLTLWFMNGATLTQSSAIGNVPLNWTVAGADSLGDIFWRNVATGEVGMWQMYGTVITKTVDFGVVPLNWTLAGIGDFDGNGSYDILWRDNQGNVGMWLMNGTQITSSTVLGNVPLNWTLAVTGDFNGDGNSDILWKDSSGNVGVWFMNGAKVSSTTIYGNVGTNWTVQALNAE